MSPWIDLNRRLLPADNPDEVPSPAVLSFVPSGSFTWAEVLPSPCVVVLGEAGSGKTTELRAQARRLADEGRAAFFLRIEILAKDDLETAIVEASIDGDLEALQRWKHASTEGWFFLDSVDEAKLRNESLQRAVAKLERDLREALARCHVVVSSRHSDWRNEDEATMARLAEKLVKPPTAGTEAFPMQRVRRAQARLDENLSEPASRVQFFRLASLSREQIRTYAEQKERLTDVDAFMNALGQADLWGLAGRPLDVEWLARSWKRRGGFASLRTMIDEDICEKLADTRDPLLHGAPICADEARDGVERIALALTMMGIDTVAVPSTSTAAPSGTLDLRSLLSGWNDDQRLGLLRLAVFDPATYGRVRFHHRTVREYLTASCLHRLRRDRYLTARQLDRLLFAEVADRRFARPGFEPVVAWLAIDDADVREHAVKVAPEHLLDLGDPTGLQSDTRRNVLCSYEHRFAGRKRTMQYFDPAGLGRFANEDVVPVIRKLLAPHLSDDLRSAVLEMIERKRLASLADDALQVATEDALPSFMRPQAIRAVVAAGTLHQKHALADAMIDRFSADRRSVDELLENLFPDVLTVDQVVALIEAGQPRTNFTAKYHAILSRLGAACPPELRIDLVKKLIDLFERLSTRYGEDIGKYLEWIPLVIVLLEQVLQDGGPIPLPSACFRLLTTAEQAGSSNRSEIAQIFVDRSFLRRAAFWDSAECWRNDYGRWPEHAREAWPYSLFQVEPDDAIWLEEDALAQPDARSCRLAFDGLMDVLTIWGGDWGRATRVAAKRLELHECLHERTSRHSEDPDGGWRHAWQMRCRAMRDRRQRTRYHDALRSELPQVRSGDAFNALAHLYDVGHERSHDNWSRAAVVERYDSDIAAAAEDGLRRLWDKHMPPATHEPPINVIPYVCLLGCLGLALEIRDGLDVRVLDQTQLRKVIIYACWQLNGFPAWLDGCAKQAPALVCELFGPSLRIDYESNDGERLIWKLATASESVRAACAPLLLELLRARDPPTHRTLSHVLRALQGLTAHEDALCALCRPRCAESIEDPKRFAMWWQAWVPLGSSEAVAFLRDELSMQRPRHISDACVLACIPAYASEQWFAPLEGKVGELLALLDVCLRHIRPSEDMKDGLGPRQHAQQFRWQVLNAVVRTGALEAIRVLDHLATQPWGSDWWPDVFKRAADDCATCAGKTQWSLREVVEFLRCAELTPRTTGDLFQVTLDVLDDIRGYIEQGILSPRATYCRDRLDEAHYQVLLSEQLERRAQGRYSVVREPEQADRNRPDLRIQANGLGPISIEVKIAERWSLPKLEAALPNQLVGKYMKDATARHGVLLLVSAWQPKPWRVARNRIHRFSDLILHLQTCANKLRAQRNTEIEGLAVVGIDFHEPDMPTGLLTRKRIAQRTQRVAWRGKKKALK